MSSGLLTSDRRNAAATRTYESPASHEVSARNLPVPHREPSSDVVAVDINPAAVECAKRNAAANGVASEVPPVYRSRADAMRRTRLTAVLPGGGRVGRKLPG